ncbi:hypothetical protein JQ580_04310 [Bradyrhizobium japonicum]|uniref:hypothetical protein n=1 Tax=Bradyrhizobium japonicum TaxID=375 RepID=UPI001BAD8AF6|nr:hypothetical protein [Bradyrhizobium japonicum]MBR0989936.1 hypothetical protein [Bradyrhizobium japonicum]
MTSSSDHKGGLGSGGTRLAHWPPPIRAMERGKQSKPELISQPAGEPAKRARPRGWRLTRAMFSEVADDD